MSIDRGMNLVNKWRHNIPVSTAVVDPDSLKDPAYVWNVNGWAVTGSYGHCTGLGEHGRAGTFTYFPYLTRYGPSGRIFW